jgi:cytoskeletal protein CcmA (bactofilin family)
MTSLPDVSDSQESAVSNQYSVQDSFAPDVHFGEWLQAVESYRTRAKAEPPPGAYLENKRLKFEDVLSFYDDVEDRISCRGTLVVTEHASLQADVEVTVAMIDGVVKGRITATKGVVLENHALVIGDIYTPELTIRGGAIIEGNCRFDVRPQTRWERPRWEAIKVGFARVWHGRIFS